MPRDWKGPFKKRLQIARSERGKRMARRRWELDRERRNKLAALTAEQNPSHITARIVVIVAERDVREFTLWSFDSFREKRRKCRAVEKMALTEGWHDY